MLKQFFLLFAIGVIVSMLAMYIFQRRLIYFPTQQIPKLADYHATDMTSVVLKTEDNLQLMSWYKPAIDNQPTILFFHGNAGHIGYRMPLVRQFINAGFGVFLLEYRGYGGNMGSPSEQGLYKDGRAALHFLNQKGVLPNQIVLYGESLGTAIATKLAIENSFCSIVLQSPFTSLTNLAHYHYPWLLIKPWDRFDSLERINKIHAPLLILHGKRDQVVPFSEGLAMFHQANEPKQMLQFADKNHNDMWSTPFSQGIINFIKTHCVLKNE